MDRNLDDYNRQGYRTHPYLPPPQRWNVVGPAYPPASNFLPPHHKGGCCPSVDSRLFVIEKKVTAIQSTVEALAAQLAGITEQQHQSRTESSMSNSGSIVLEQEVRPLIIPGTSKERKELIKKMEEELEDRREENRHHEERIAGLRRELEELRARNAK